MALSDLRDKYPDYRLMKYEPNSDCPYCKGSGEVIATASGQRPCICVYVANQKAAKLAQEALSKMARDFRAALAPRNRG